MINRSIHLIIFINKYKEQNHTLIHSSSSFMPFFSALSWLLICTGFCAYMTTATQIRLSALKIILKKLFWKRNDYHEGVEGERDVEEGHTQQGSQHQLNGRGKCLQYRVELLEKYTGQYSIGWGVHYHENYKGIIERFYCWSSEYTLNISLNQ